MPKNVFGHYNMKNRDSLNIDIRNCELRVNFDIENMILGNIPNAKVDFDHNNMKIELTSEIVSRKSKIKLTPF